MTQRIGYGLLTAAGLTAFLAGIRLGRRRARPAAEPRIVCLCGSTRFGEAAWRQANLAETLAGRIVLSIGCNTKSGADLAAAGALGLDLAAAKPRLDALHKAKIRLADEVLFLNVGGYLGESSRAELVYALALGKEVRFLEPPGLSGAARPGRAVAKPGSLTNSRGYADERDRT